MRNAISLLIKTNCFLKVATSTSLSIQFPGVLIMPYRSRYDKLALNHPDLVTLSNLPMSMGSEDSWWQNRFHRHERITNEDTTIGHAPGFQQSPHEDRSTTAIGASFSKVPWYFFRKHIFKTIPDIVQPVHSDHRMSGRRHILASHTSAKIEFRSDRFQSSSVNRSLFSGIPSELQTEMSHRHGFPPSTPMESLSFLTRHL